MPYLLLLARPSCVSSLYQVSQSRKEINIDGTFLCLLSTHTPLYICECLSSHNMIGSFFGYMNYILAYSPQRSINIYQDPIQLFNFGGICTKFMASILVYCQTHEYKNFWLPVMLVSFESWPSRLILFWQHSRGCVLLQIKSSPFGSRGFSQLGSFWFNCYTDELGVGGEQSQAKTPQSPTVYIWISVVFHELKLAICCMSLVDFQGTDIVFDTFVQFYHCILYTEFAELLS